AKNYWKTAINGVTVKFTLPPDFTYESSAPPGTYDGVNHAVTWSNVSLPLKTSFDNPGLVEFIVHSRAGRKIDHNIGTLEITLPFTATVDGIPQDCQDNLVQPDSPISEARERGGGRVCIDFPWVVQKTSDRSSVAPRDTNRRLRFTVKFISRINASQLFTPR